MKWESHLKPSLEITRQEYSVRAQVQAGFWAFSVFLKGGGQEGAKPACVLNKVHLLISSFLPSLTLSPP